MDRHTWTILSLKDLMSLELVGDPLDRYKSPNITCRGPNPEDPKGHGQGSVTEIHQRPVHDP